MGAALYFAYGSNLSSARLRERVPSARALGGAWIGGYALALDKLGADGSAKANLRAEAGASVHGVVYELDAWEWPRLDACEGGYLRFEVEARLGERRVLVQTYRSDRLTRDALAFGWYKRLMLDGAREHGLDSEWIAFLSGLPVRDE